MPGTGKTQINQREEAGNRYNKLNMRLAGEIHQYLIAYSRAHDRGVKRSRWKVLKQAQCPAVLLELGFLTNDAEQSKLMRDEYQNRLAYGIVNGILSFQYATATKHSQQLGLSR